MRDFRDAKPMAQTLRAALAAKGVKITIAESLELVAKALGAADWNTLAAAIKTAAAQAKEAPADPPPADAEMLNTLARMLGPKDWDELVALVQSARSRKPPADAPPPAAQVARRSGTSFAPTLVATLHRAVAAANSRRHGYTTLEHLLLALADDADAAAVMEACQVDLGQLRTTLTRYLDEELTTLTQMGDSAEAVPTAGFHRVIQRAVIHIQSAGRADLTGANVLVAIFSERESQAAHFLKQQKIDRFDAVNFIAHGVRKDGKAA